MNLEDPKIYFDTLVKPCFLDWTKNMNSMGTEHKLRSLCIYLHSLSEVVAISKIKPLSDYKKELAEKCTDFQLVADIANSTKHIHLTKGQPKFKNINMLKLAQAETIDDAGYIDDIINWDKGTYWLLQDDSGNNYSIYEIIDNVINMWEKEIEIE
jgi:hypothetical protein